MSWFDDIEKALNRVLPQPHSSTKRVEIANVEQANKLIESIRASNDANVASAGFVSDARGKRPSSVLELTVGIQGGSANNWNALPPGKALVLLRETSSPGVTFTVELDDVTYYNVPIGSRLNTPWDKGRILIDYPNNLANEEFAYAGSWGMPSASTVVRIVVVNDTFDIIEPPVVPELRGVFLRQFSQTSNAYNAPANPADYTNGVSVDGAKLVRVTLQAAPDFAGGGSVRLWKTTPLLSSFSMGFNFSSEYADSAAMTQAAGTNKAVFEFKVAPVGRVYPDCRMVTTAADPATIIVTCEVIG